MRVWVVVAKNDAKSILTTETVQDKVPSVALSRMITNEQTIPPYPSTNMLQFTARLVNYSTAPVTLVVGRKEEDDLQVPNFNDMVIFKDDVLTGVMDMHRIQGYILGAGEVNGGSVEIIIELGNADLKTTESICKQEVQLDNQGNITFKPEVNTILSIGALQNFHSMDINEVISLVNERAEGNLETKIKAYLAKSQCLQADAYGIDAHIHKYHPKEWKTMEDAWASIHPEIRLEPEVETNLGSSGKISESLSMREGHE